MDVLVIGGSVFLGRAVVSEALAIGADVTVFNRGRSGAKPPGATQVVGDRTSREDLAQLAGRRFDVVVDTCGYVPAVAALSAALLAPACDRYAFVSSINAYPGWPTAEDYRAGGVHDGDPDATEAPGGFDPAHSYGWLKVGCERAVERAFGSARTSVLRAGCIVGPDDSAIGRLPWWLDRVARGGEVLVPGAPSDPVALVDARDVARFALGGAVGTFEVPGPVGRDTRADLMAACAAATGAAAELTYVDSAWLHGPVLDRGAAVGARLGSAERVAAPPRGRRGGGAHVASAGRDGRRHLGLAAVAARGLAADRPDPGAGGGAREGTAGRLARLGRPARPVSARTGF
jgi:2'-hydroxyisoflavone reductase